MAPKSKTPKGRTNKVRTFPKATRFMYADSRSVTDIDPEAEASPCSDDYDATVAEAETNLQNATEAEPQGRMVYAVVPLLYLERKPVHITRREL